jgi:hypothetical protein
MTVCRFQRKLWNRRGWYPRHTSERKHRCTNRVNGRESNALCEWSDTHVWKKKDVIKKQRGGFKYKKNKTIYFFFSYIKRYSNTYTFLHSPHSCTVVKQYKELTTKILSITFLILAFLTIHLGDHGEVNVLISLLVISQFLIKLLHLCIEEPTRLPPRVRASSQPERNRHPQ